MGNLSQFWKRTRQHGLSWAVLNGIGQVRRRGLERSFRVEQPKALSRCLEDAVKDYSSLNRGLLHFVEDFGDSSTLALLKHLAPDVVLCLGGPVYPKSFIQSCPLVLNYHSGYSPIYNGTSTIWFAFANGHPHWCAGTLMTMNPVVDGGDILGHFLPDISPDDNPLTLFLKTTLGAAILYDRILKSFERAGIVFARVPQPRPFFDFRAIDWTLIHVLNVKKHVRRKTCAAFVREQRVEEYWRQPTESAARELFERTTRDLMWRRE